MGWESGAWYRVWTFYGLGLYGYATLMLARAAFRAQHFLRSQYFLLLVAAALPALGNVLWLSSRGPLPHLDLTPLGFGISGLLVGWSLFRFGFLDVVPVARETVFEELDAGVIVLDWRGRVVDMNPAAETIVGSSARGILGHTLDEVLPAASEVVNRAREAEQPAWGDVEIVHGEGRLRGVVRVQPDERWVARKLRGERGAHRVEEGAGLLVGPIVGSVGRGAGAYVTGTG